jgi:hypothetical protein
MAINPVVFASEKRLYATGRSHRTGEYCAYKDDDEYGTYQQSSSFGTYRHSSLQSWVAASIKVTHYRQTGGAILLRRRSGFASERYLLL